MAARDSEPSSIWSALRERVAKQIEYRDLGVRTLLILTADAGQSDPSPSVRAASATRFQKVQTASLYRFMSASLTMN